MAIDPKFLNELFRIVNGALRLDLDRVRNYTAFLADRLDAQGDRGAAERLRKLLEQSSNELRPTGAQIGAAVPVDPESRFPLIERVNLRALPKSPLILAEHQSALLREFLSIAKSQAQLEAAGVGSALNLLLYGPPGCGKSRIARYVAEELGLDLYVARLDGLVSSYLGSTSKNIRALFDFAAKQPCVLFLDEFDAIAKIRSDTQELGELKRVVNSFIQSLDTIGLQSIVLAATNHEELLDSAIWRRFSYRMEVTYPDTSMRSEMWRAFAATLDFSARDVAALVDLSDGFSGADIEESCLRMRRMAITQGEGASLHRAFLALMNIAQGTGANGRFLSVLRIAEPRSIACALRQRNADLYSHAVVASILNVSKATSQRWTAEEGQASGG